MRKRHRQVLLGFYTEDGETKPLTKPLKEVARKKVVVNPRRFKGIQPTLPFRKYYHGTTFESKQEILRHGIDPSKLQQRDSGFFGKGFYVSSRRRYAKMYGRSIVTLKVKPTAKILKVNSKKPNPWDKDFLAWYVDLVNKNKKLSAEQKEKAIDFFKREGEKRLVHPPARYWSKNVTDYAKDRGFDIVEHVNGGETVILNPEAVSILKK